MQLESTLNAARTAVKTIDAATVALLTDDELYRSVMAFKKMEVAQKSLTGFFARPTTSTVGDALAALRKIEAAWGSLSRIITAATARSNDSVNN
jgi:hypothetical protein